MPLAHPPGDAQADFGEAVVIIDGIEQKAHFFVLDLPHSDACFVRAYPAATAEAWMDGHVHAFAFFGTERLTGALLDRLTHHVNILEMNGESYRLAQSRARKSTDTA